MSDPLNEQQPSSGVAATIAPSVPLNARVEALHSGEQEREIVPTNWDQFAASLAHGFMSGATASLTQGYLESRDRDADAKAGVQKISPEQANKQFPGMPEAFNEPVYPREAAIKYQLWQREQRDQEWISRGGKMSAWESFASGGISGSLDPVTLALTYATGGASKALGVSSSLRNVFLQNLAINSVSGAITYNQQKADRQNPSLGDAAFEAVAGATIGTGIHYTLGKLFGRSKEEFKNTPPDVREQNLKTAIAQEEAGAKIDTSLGDNVAQARRSAPLQGGVETLPENTHYVGVTADGSFVSQDPNLGPGIQTSNNGHLINNLASDGKGGGYVGKLKIPEDAKFFNLDQPATAEYGSEKSFLKQVEKEFGIELKPEEGETIRDVIDRLHDMSTDEHQWHEAMGRVQDILKSDGFMGYEFSGTDSSGQATDARKHLFLADNRLTDGQTRLGTPELADQRITPDEGFQANSDIVPNATPDQVLEHFKESVSPENSKYTTPDLEQEVHDLKHGDSVNSTPEYMDPVLDQQIESSKALLDKFAESDPALKAELDEIYKEMNTTDKQTENTLKTLADCVVESMV